MKNKKILVIGESCRDIFIYCDAKRLCPDIPVPVLNELDRAENAGMAKNVQRNIQSLTRPCDIITNKQWYNVTKTRYMHQSSNHMFFRVDTPHDIEPINLKTIDYHYEIVVISDYNKGFLSEKDIQTICTKHGNVFLDTKKVLGKWAYNAKYIKINDYEYQNSEPYLDDILKRKIIHTQGDRGCVFQNKDYQVKKVDVKDSSGAGDSFMAALVVEYHNSNNIEQSIRFANKCATEAVKQRGVNII